MGQKTPYRYLLTISAILLTSSGFADGFFETKFPKNTGLATMPKTKFPNAPCEEVKKEEPKCDPIYDSRIQIGGSYNYLHLVPDASAGFDGSLWGAQGLYEYRPVKAIYAAAKVSYRQGNTTHASDECSIFYIDTQERVGYTFGSNRPGSSCSLYTGIGYHYLGQQVTVTGHAPTHFGYNEFYVPVGFAFEYKNCSWFSIGLNGTWMPQVFSMVSVDPVDGAYWTISRTLSNFQVEVPFGFAMGEKKRFELFITPYVEYWQDGKSFEETTVGIGVVHPGNTYYYGGVEVNFAYSF